MNLNDRINRIESTLLSQYERLLKKKLVKALVNNNFTQVLIFSNQLIEINSSIASYYYSRGLAHYNLKQSEDAVKDFNACLFMDPSAFPEAKEYLELCGSNNNEFEGRVKINIGRDLILS